MFNVFCFISFILIRNYFVYGNFLNLGCEFFLQAMFKFSVLSCLVCGEFMGYCSNCGEKLTKEALYCARCGVKAVENIKAGKAAPSDEMHEALTRMSQEMEKAFTIAAKEIQEAFQTAKNNVQKTLYKEPVVCPNCGEKNSGAALYCFKCGKKLQGDLAEQPK